MHLIQEDNYREPRHGELLQLMQRNGYAYQQVQVKPFVREIMYEPFAGNRAFCWGSVKLAHVAPDYGWQPGSLYNTNHRFQAYAPHYGEFLLNHDSQIIRFGNDFTPPGYLFFARPCENTKAFTGQTFSKASWDEFVTQTLTRGRADILNADTPIQISPLKDIEREVRTWIVKGQVITASQYKRHERMEPTFCNDAHILDFAQRMANLYQPAEAFVLDVAETEQGLRVVEINCINSAGFYACDLELLVKQVHEAFLA